MRTLSTTRPMKAVSSDTAPFRTVRMRSQVFSRDIGTTTRTRLRDVILENCSTMCWTLCSVLPAPCSTRRSGSASPRLSLLGVSTCAMWPPCLMGPGIGRAFGWRSTSVARATSSDLSTQSLCCKPPAWIIRRNWSADALATSSSLWGSNSNRRLDSLRASRCAVLRRLGLSTFCLVRPPTDGLGLRPEIGLVLSSPSILDLSGVGAVAGAGHNSCCRQRPALLFLRASFARARRSPFSKQSLTLIPHDKTTLRNSCTDAASKFAKSSAGHSPEPSQLSSRRAKTPAAASVARTNAATRRAHLHRICTLSFRM
mmetsp:Transcript_109209/g.307996  ORF Transcript_109209/g.307996 Transcript_109209/m.307996 type:complete len:313 (+) Transcript_109209:269-1207(+)